MNGKHFFNDSLMVYKYYKRKHPDKHIIIFQDSKCISFEDESFIQDIIDDENSLNIVHVNISEDGYSFDKKYLKNINPLETMVISIE